MRKIFTVVSAAFAVMLIGGVSAASAQNLDNAPRELSVSEAGEADETWTSIGECEYSDAVLSNLQSGFFNTPVKVMVEESNLVKGRYRVVDPWPGVVTDVEKYLIIDATDPDFVMVPTQRAVIYDPVDGETWFRSINEWAVTDMGLTKEKFLESPLGNCNPTLKDMVIYFPNNFLAVMWPYAVSGQTPGVWTIGNGEYSGYLVLPGGKLDDGWEPIGTGRMFDGFVWTIFEENAPVEKDVEIMRSKENPGVYKLVKPFADIDASSLDLIIDASDPDFVLISKQNTGLDSTNGYTYVLSLSANNYTDYDSMVADNPDNAKYNITMSEGRIDIPAGSVRLFFPDIDNMNIYKNDLAVDGYVQLPTLSVPGVSAAFDGEPEYYNLQGVRVTSPASGEFVIVRRGSEVSKMVMP